MGADTGIEWATHTFNPWWGCTRVEGSPACGPTDEFPDGAKCYAESFSERIGYSEKGKKFPIWGAHSKRRLFGDNHWDGPLEWNAAALKQSDQTRVFCMSMGDWAEGRPDQAPHIDRLWRLIERTPALEWLMLTKRPQLITKLCPLRLHRVWQGVTAETQSWLDLRWAHLQKVDSAIKWLSVEPMFGPIVLPNSFLELGGNGWVICGGQSGARAAHMNPDWARRLRDQCLDRGVKFHMKQMSGVRKSDREAIPEDLLIRQYPGIGEV